MSREEVARWAAQAPKPMQVFGSAGAVVDSLSSADEFENGEPLIRRQELQAYLRWLTEGEGFWGDDLPLVSVRRSLDSLDEVDATTAIRFWETGLGWGWERRFMSKATGRAFVASSSSGGAPPSIRKQRGDDPHRALADLLEVLSLEPSEVTYVQDGVSLEHALALEAF